MKIAVITPYFDEPLSTLRANWESVHAQAGLASVELSHVLVADGVDRPDVRTWEAQHIVLPRNHSDNGNTPRAIGAISAMNQGVDAIAFLDADNWYYPEHLHRLLTLQKSTQAWVCTATRDIRRHDGSMMFTDRTDSDGNRHVDTSCLLLMRPAFGILPVWAKMPRQLSPICDRVFWNAIVSKRFPVAHCTTPTVGFRTRYRYHYGLIGETPPAGCKSAEQSTKPAFQWWDDLDPQSRSGWESRLGIAGI